MKKIKQNIKQFLKDKPELTLIIQILNKKELSNSKVWDNIEEKEFIRLVKHHRLDSILYREIELQKIVLPNDLKTKLEQINKRNKMQMLQLTSELIRIHQLFTKNGIEYISLKGPALSQQIYGDYAVRSSKDLDILIHPRNIDKISELLGSIDFSSKMQNSSIKRLSDKDQVFFNSKGIMIELHYRLFNNKFLLPYSEKYLSDPEYVEINKQKIPILPRWFYLLYQIGHSASHNWSRMVWSLDVIHFRKQLSPKGLNQASDYTKQVGISEIYKQAINSDLYQFAQISNEEHYHFLKKFIFLLSLNDNKDYKKHEILQRLFIPYRIIKKYLF